MQNIDKIIITRNTVANKKAVNSGTVLVVGRDIQLNDARFLIQIKKAAEYKEPEVSSDKQPTEKELEAMKPEALFEYVGSIDLNEVSKTRLKLLKKLWKDAGIEDEFPE